MVWITTSECLTKTVLSSPDGTRSSAKTTPALKRWAILRGKGAKHVPARRRLQILLRHFLSAFRCGFHRCDQAF